MAERISGDIFFEDNNTFGILDLEPILTLEELRARRREIVTRAMAVQYTEDVVHYAIDGEHNNLSIGDDPVL
jgi:hypothetical protein